MDDDAAVIRRVLDGEVEAFRILVERHQRPLCGMVRRLLPGTTPGPAATWRRFGAFRD